MTLYITKNGQRLGPFTTVEVQSMITAGTLNSADWAWYEGLTDWIPLNQVPGIATATGPLPQRPALVWVISIFYGLSTASSLFSLFVFMFSRSFPHHQSHVYFFVYGISPALMGVQLTGAIMLFLMRRPAFYCFAGSLAVRVLIFIYDIVVTRGFPAPIPVFTRIFFELGINVAVAFYVWRLFKKGVLR